jgi:DNA-3-methyladenine glycosylase
MAVKLGKEFFNRSTLRIAEELLGKYLVRKIGKKTIALKITEVEAYDGPNDKASHACRGETKRTKVMFGEAGVWYVYLCYGIHEMLNIVTGEVGYPAAILIRGVEGYSGPARLTKFLKIDRTLNNKKAISSSGLWIEDRGEKISQKDIKRTPRIGVAYAGPIWSQKKYRFLLKN